MNVWIINPYGNIPGENWRLHRSYIAAKAFENRGHDVTYWISNIDHRSKRERECSNIIDNKLTINIVKSSNYSEHISFKRILFEINFIKNFKKLGQLQANKPDLIVIGEPSVFLSFTFVSFVRKYKIKFIVDIVDIWPELFKIILPKLLKSFDKIIFFPLYWKRWWFVRQAHGILAVSNTYLKIGINLNPFVPHKNIYLGVDLNSFNATNNITESNTLNIIYAGTLGNNYDIKSIINCAKKIQKEDHNIRIYIAGDGNLSQFVIDSISKYKLINLVYVGRISPEILISYYQKCHLALSTYSKDSSVSMPVKAFDYFAAGLPLINSLGMDLGKLIDDFGLGLNYKAGNDKELFEKIIFLNKNRNILKKMRTNCLNIAKRFDSTKIYIEYVQFCEEIILNKL